jgi:glyoxylase-like metal-dependent hydrolase (beta-lactamase superfamily II)
VRTAEISDLGGGVHRVTHPLPWALDHVHCYAVADPDGWTLVDAGLGTPQTIAGWRDALALLGRPRVRRLVVTHFHPDHLGASAALAELTGAGEVIQGALDREVARRVWGGDRDAGGFERHLERLGMPPAAASAAALAERSTPVAAAVPTRLVRAGDAVEIAGVRFDVLDLPGHADGHIALHDAAGGRLFGGDVLLAEITPNVGLWAESRPDPLGAYLATLDRIAALAPAIVYPGHRRPIRDAAARAREIGRHHADRLDAHVAALAAGHATPFRVSRAIWGPDLGEHEQTFALTEAAAHLARLVAVGRAVEGSPGRFATA